MNFIGYALFGWFLIILTGIGSIACRRFVGRLRRPPPLPPPREIPKPDPIKQLQAKIDMAMQIVESVPDEDERECLARGVQAQYRKEVLRRLFGGNL